MCFSVNFAKFLRTSFLQNTSGLLLLYLESKRLSVNLYEILSEHWECISEDKYIKFLEVVM